MGGLRHAALPGPAADLQRDQGDGFRDTIHRHIDPGILLVDCCLAFVGAQRRPGEGVVLRDSGQMRRASLQRGRLTVFLQQTIDPFRHTSTPLRNF